MKKELLAICFYLFTANLFAQQIKYSTCPGCWDTDSLGNHRAVVQFNGEGKFATAKINWRRRDSNPQQKDIIIEDAQTQKKILNVKTGNINREYGELYFEPVSGKGNYYIYYMPSANEGRSNYPKGIYLKPEYTADINWLSLIKSIGNNATVTRIESIDLFNSFYPMEVSATKKETAKLVAKTR